MGLVLKEKICVDSPQGTSEIQLLFGDITQLTMEEKVDFIFVSAFPGDYTPVPGTLIGALKRNLGLAVGEIARHKAMDLRRLFNCWVSEPLPTGLPYKRLACFERLSRSEKLTDQISGMFRAMMPVFNNEDTTVITPLLAAGNQNLPEKKVLSSIVSAACHWIQAGLPLRCLKIVLYKQNIHAFHECDTEIMDVFSKLKTKWEKSKIEEIEKVKMSYDVCMSFAGQDSALVNDICQTLKKMYNVIIIHNDEFAYDHEKVWQDEIFNIMVHSRKVVAVLTPNYLENAECLEQFNLALCCNRLTKSEVLAPFYLQTVSAFPSYMMLIQYTECRVRKEGEKADEKMFTACSLLISELEKDKTGIEHIEAETTDKSNTGDTESAGANSSKTQRQTSETSKGKGRVYDIFISYAHRTPTEANKMYENLLDIDPDLKIFLDRSELRTGNSWQEALYEAVDNAKVVVAFITKSYIQSTVCQEEFNIALARYMSMDGIYLVPLLIDTDLTEVPAMFAGAPLVDMKDPTNRYNEQYHNLAEAPIGWLREAKNGGCVLNRFNLPEPRKTRISFVTVKWREWDFNHRFKFIKGQNLVLTAKTAVESANQLKKSVVICYAHDCYKHAMFLSHSLKQQKDVIACEFLVSPQATTGMQAPKLQLLDSADVVAVFVSDDFIASDQHRQQLHIALCRQRTVKDRRVVYLIEANHTRLKPTYIHLLPYSICMGDELWSHLAKHGMNWESQAVKIDLPGEQTMTIYCSGAEKMALFAAAIDITDKLYAERKEGGSGMPTNIINMVNLMKRQSTSTVPVEQCLVPFSLLRNDKNAIKSQGEGQAADEPVFPDVPSEDPEANDDKDNDDKENSSRPTQQQRGDAKKQGGRDSARGDVFRDTEKENSRQHNECAQREDRRETIRELSSSSQMGHRPQSKASSTCCLL